LSWGFVATIIAIAAIIVLYFWAQKAAVSSKEIVLLAALTAIAALGRIPFAAIPSVQPTTFIIMLSGCIFGPQAGFMVGASAALVSNFFLGQGPWTPWQMMAWGLVGAGTAFFYRLWPGNKPVGLALLGIFWGYIFGWIQNLGFWLAFVYPLNIQSFLATYAASIIFDSLHAACNFCLCLVLAAPVLKILQEYQEKITYRVLSAEEVKDGDVK
jgi:energy-coupling factor transport system substrate-specific component